MFVVLDVVVLDEDVGATELIEKPEPREVARLQHGDGRRVLGRGRHAIEHTLGLLG